MPEITVDGTKVSYLEAGGGSPVILLHSSASSKAQWQDLCSRLEGRYRVVAPDLYGYGDTGEWPGAGPLGLAEEARLVSALAARLDGPFHLVGHSYGGAVALRLALEGRFELSSLTLVEPVAFYLLRGAGPVEQELFAEVGELADRVAEAVAAGDPAGGMAHFVDFWNGPGTWERSRAELRAALGRRTAKVVSDFQAVFNEPTPLAAYGQIRVPTLILWGEASHPATHAIAEHLSAVMPAARLQIVEGAGHMMPLSHPEAVGTAIVRHLDRVAGGRPAA